MAGAGASVVVTVVAEAVGWLADIDQKTTGDGFTANQHRIFHAAPVTQAYLNGPVVAGSVKCGADNIAAAALTIGAGNNTSRHHRCFANLIRSEERRVGNEGR